jgi:peptide/nickel transport system substrate-binding protein
VLNNLQMVGIRAKLRPLERAAFFKSYAEKKLKNIIQGSSGAFSNAARRLEAFVGKLVPPFTAAIPTSTRSFRSKRWS